MSYYDAYHSQATAVMEVQDISYYGILLSYQDIEINYVG